MSPEYAAGFFDGEGSVLIYKRVGKRFPRSVTIPYQVRGTVSNTNPDVIIALKATFGGSVYEYLPTRNRRRAWKWTITAQMAAAFFRTIRPHLVIKGAEVDLALTMQQRIGQSRLRTRPGHRGQPALPQEEIDARDAIWRALQDHRKLRH